MKTTELIKILTTENMTKNQVYNLLIEDLEIATCNDAGSIADPMPQALIRFYMYQIEEVLFPVIADLKTQLKQVENAGQLFKDELDTRDANLTSILKTEADVYLNTRIDGALRMIESHHHDYVMDSARVRDGLQEQINGLKRAAGRVGV